MRWPMVVLAALTATPAVAADVWREQSRQDVERRGLSVLEIRNARGRIDITPSTDGRIHLTALKIVRHVSEARARRLAEDVVVETGRSGDRYRVEVRYPDRVTIDFGLFGVKDRSCEVRIAAQVPPDLAIDAHTASGEIRSEGISAAQTIRSVSGDVEVLAAGGPVQLSSTSGRIDASGLGRGKVNTVSGDLSVDGVRGPLRASSTSGAIQITGADDSLSLSTVSGDIQLDRAPRGLVIHSSSGHLSARSTAGSVTAGTVSGDIDLGAREPLRSISASTSSGAIHVTLDDQVRCALDLHSSSGTLDVGMPIEMHSMTRRAIQGRVRGGSTPVTLRTVSGDITVMGGGQR